MTEYEEKRHKEQTEKKQPYRSGLLISDLPDDVKLFFNFLYRREMCYIAVIVAEAIAIAVLYFTR